MRVGEEWEGKGLYINYLFITSIIVFGENMLRRKNIFCLTYWRSTVQIQEVPRVWHLVVVGKSTVRAEVQVTSQKASSDYVISALRRTAYHGQVPEDLKVSFYTL